MDLATLEKIRRGRLLRVRWEAGRISRELERLIDELGEAGIRPSPAVAGSIRSSAAFLRAIEQGEEAGLP